MKKSVMYLSIFLVLCCLKSVASADYYSREFGDMDLSHDDSVNFEEYRHYVSGATVEGFRQIDTNEDKKIDFFEWVEFQKIGDPFGSKRGFKYKGKSGTWYLDRHGNRYKHKEEYYCGPRYDCWPDYWYGCRQRHHYGMCWDHCHRPARSGWTIGVGFSNIH